MNATALWQFVVASMIIIMVPGPSVLFTLSRGIAWGRAVAVLTVLGNSLGTLLLSLIVAVGLGPLLTRSHLFSLIIQMAGGVYLLYLGIDALRHRRELAAAMLEREERRPQRWRVVRQGFTVGILNPKSLVFFVAVFPHFVTTHQGNATPQLMMMGVLFSVMAFCSDGMWGVIAGTAREWLAGAPRRLVALRTVGGVVITSLGVLIIVPTVTSLV